MSQAHHRPKDPAALRQQLLDSAARIIATRGLPALTLDKVVKESGISKGGLQHHFATRQALVDGVFQTLQLQMREEIDQEMAREPDTEGRATRAYIRACARLMPDHEQEMNRALMAAMMADPRLRDEWAEFINQLPQDPGDEAISRQRLLCRLAADGMWFAALCGCHSQAPEQRRWIIEQLLTLAERVK